MITKNSNNSGLFKDIEGSKYTEPKQAKQDRIALLYFIENNNEDEAQIYSASDILFKDAGDDNVFAARILSIVERYYHKENIVLSLADMKDIMGRYVADQGFSDESIEFAKDTINGYEISIKEGSRIVMISVETYAQALK
jgi:hypothetical protein